MVSKKEIVEAVTIGETLPVVAVVIAGYIETSRSIRALKTVWAEHIGEESQEEGLCCGLQKRVLTLRKSLVTRIKKLALEKVKIVN